MRMIITSFTFGMKALSAMTTSKSLNHGWRFLRGDLPRTNHCEGMQAYRPRMHLTKSGLHHMPSMPGFDDQGWRDVSVPHDWAIEGLPDPDPAIDVNHGSRVGGIGWYRKTFNVAAEDAGQRVWLEFDGVYRDCEVWINGCFAGANQSGYIGFRIDVSEWIRFGAENAISVRVDASEFEGWWYEGAGIYRSVRLVTGAGLHVVPDGVAVRTHLDSTGCSVAVAVELANAQLEDVESEVVITCADAQGVEVGSSRAHLPLAADERGVVHVMLPVPHAQLWTPAVPFRYRLTVQVRAGGVTCDQFSTMIGLRTVAADAERGFLLNGQPLKLKGVSCHQDFAGIGVALPDALQDHRIRLLKDMGANAYRSAHHAPSPALLDACDRLGFLVLDETRIFGTSDEALSQLERLVRRDRRHPSVVMWSIGNEEMSLQGNAVGVQVARRMRRLVNQFDSTRPVTLAMNGDWMGPLAADPTCLDVVGFNYGPEHYDAFHQQFPTRPAIGSETGANLATRGHYGNSPFTGKLTWDAHVAACAPRAASDFDPAYCQADGDTCAAFGGTPWDTWRAVAERDFIMGTFIWTGFDYRGEPCPMQRWPNINTNFGIMDLCGFPKDTWWYYRAWWSAQPSIHLLPHWDWAGRDGQLVNVRCFANAAQVELVLNGMSLGIQDMPALGFIDWQVAYAPGTLEAIGRWPDGHSEKACVYTSGRPTRVQLTVDRLPVGDDGRTIALARIAVVDEHGHGIPTAAHQMRLKTGAGVDILGVHNGDPAFTDAEQSNRVRLFNGLALVVLEITTATDGPLLTVEAEGLQAS